MIKLFWPRIHTNMNTPLPLPKKRCQLVHVFTFIKIIVTSSFYFALEMTSRIYIPNFMQLPGGVLNTTCSKLTCIGKFIPEVSKIIHELSMFSEQRAKLRILFIQNLFFLLFIRIYLSCMVRFLDTNIYFFKVMLNVEM